MSGGKLKIKNLKKLFQNVLTTVFINAIIKTVDKEEYFMKNQQKKLYYVLSLDNYGQPDGNILEVYLTEEEARRTPYCYKDYERALYRALD